MKKSKIVNVKGCNITGSISMLREQTIPERLTGCDNKRNTSAMRWEKSLEKMENERRKNRNSLMMIGIINLKKKIITDNYHRPSFLQNESKVTRA